MEQLCNGLRKLLEFRQIMNGQHAICVLVQHFGTCRQRCIPFKTQQGVEPQQRSAVAFEPSQLIGQDLRFAGVQAVTDQQHHCASPHQTTPVCGAQSGQGSTQAGATCKVLNALVGGFEHVV